MKIQLPIERIRELMHAKVICEVHCKGIDLCKSPIDHRDDKIDRNGDIRDHDFLLFGYQKYAGGANEGDIATATLVDLDSELASLQKRQQLQQNIITEFAQIRK